MCVCMCVWAIQGGRAVGVRMANGLEIKCKHAVVSGAGYAATTAMLADDILQRYDIPRELSTVKQSAGE